MRKKLDINQNSNKYVAFYGRVSTKHQVEDGESLESQLFLAEEYVNKHKGDYTLLTFVDKGVSASRVHFEKRPELMKMLSAAQAGKFSTLLVYKRDRLDRTAGFHTIMYTLQKAKVEVIYLSPDEPVTANDPYGNMMEQIIVSVAALEPELTAIRVKDTMRSKALKGYWYNGNIPYGLYRDKETSKIIPIAKEAKVIKDIFDLYTNKGLGARRIAEHLNDENIPFRNPQNILRKWTPNQITYIVQNTIYMGFLTYNDEHDGEVKIIRCKNIEDPIISRDIFEQATEIRRKRRNLTYTPRRLATTYLLRDIFYCSCGAKMYSIDNSYKYINKFGKEIYKSYTYYRCSKYHLAKHNGVCEVKTIKAEGIHKLVLSKCQEIFKPKNYQDTIDKLNKTQNHTIDKLRQKIQEYRRRIADIKRKIEVLYENLETTTESHIVKAYEVRLTKRNEELQHLKTIKLNDKQLYKKIREKTWSVAEISKKLADWSNKIFNVSSDVQRRMVLDVLSEVRLDKNGDIKLKLNISLDNFRKIERGAHNYTYVHLFPLVSYVRCNFPIIRSTVHILYILYLKDEISTCNIWNE